MSPDKCDHDWHFRRYWPGYVGGYWECLVCELKSHHIGLDVHGGPAEGPPDSERRTQR